MLCLHATGVGIGKNEKKNFYNLNNDNAISSIFTGTGTQKHDAKQLIKNGTLIR